FLLSKSGLVCQRRAFPKLPNYWAKLSSQGCVSFWIIGKKLSGGFGKGPIFLFLGGGFSTHVRVETATGDPAPTGTTTTVGELGCVDAGGHFGLGFDGLLCIPLCGFRVYSPHFNIDNVQ